MESRKKLNEAVAPHGKKKHVVKIEKKAAHLAKYQFKKGQSGNPGGRSMKTQVLTHMRSAFEQDFAEACDAVLRIPKEELRGLLKNDRVPMFVICIARIVLKCVEHGDPVRLSYLKKWALGDDRPKGEGQKENKYEAIIAQARVLNEESLEQKRIERREERREQRLREKKNHS